MKPLGSIELQTIELPDKLQFVFGYQAGWGDLAAPTAAFLIILGWAWSTEHYIPGAIVLVAFIVLALYWLNITPTRLSVSTHELVTRGNHTRNVHNEITIPVSDVQSLRFLPAGNQGPAGLYALRGSKQTCLIPGISSEESTAMVRLIRKKFPQIERGDQPRTLQFI